MTATSEIGENFSPVHVIYGMYMVLQSGKWKWRKQKTEAETENLKLGNGRQYWLH